MNYYIYYPPELYHHGVKGMKWGVRKSIQSNMQVRGYRLASKYVQKKDVKTLKAQKRSGSITRAEYRAKKRSIKVEASYQRGKDLVSHNQTYANTLVKGLGKNVATSLGAVTLGSMALMTGLPAVAVMTYAAGDIKNKVDASETVSRLHDLHTYKKQGGK